MRRIIQRPDPVAVINSMRAIGYSFDTALSDIIDNSITAESTRVDIIFRNTPTVAVAILDNGRGMTEETLIEAMRHGSGDPRNERDARDLGRYGLGLKTASLSQCRKLTVVSLMRDKYAAACWDVDDVEEAGDWILSLPEYEDVRSLPGVDELASLGRGTLVIWQHFDRASAGSNNESQAVEMLVDEARHHLALTFHRYIEGDSESSIAIRINGVSLPSVDPFLKHVKKTEPLPAETMVLRGHRIIVQPYILPHISHIKDEVVRNNLKQSQGFYLYRNKRLICHGTWFRLIRHEELSKLARVSIDIPNAVDDLWSIDIRKSTAYPPPAIRLRLKELVQRIAGRSESVFKERRRRLGNEQITHIWDRVLTRGAVQYIINHAHPLLADFQARLNPELRRTFDKIMEILQLSLPTDAIFADVAKSTQIQQSDKNEVYQQLLSLAHLMLGMSLDRDHTLHQLPFIEPFSIHQTVTQQIIEDLKRHES